MLAVSVISVILIVVEAGEHTLCSIQNPGAKRPSLSQVD